MATGYTNAFITVAPDCPAKAGSVPERATSIAGLEHRLLTEKPYGLTGDDLILAVHLRHKGIKRTGREAFRAALFSKPHPCLRASMLPKRYGWGVHYDDKGRIALYGVESDDYRRFAAQKDLQVILAMRNRRSSKKR